VSPDRSLPGEASLPEPFVAQVKGALEHLYDFAYLQRHPLARDGEPGGGGAESAGQGLRRRVTVAVETLSPGPQVRFGAPHSRPYHLLVAHYVEGATIQEAANELGISRRQAHRDLRRGVESVAVVLWSERPSAPASAELGAAHMSSVREEMDRLGSHPQPTEIRSLVHRAVDAVDPMAQLQGVSIEADISSEPIVVTADPMLARQVLISLISNAVSLARSGVLSLDLSSDKETAKLSLRWENSPAVSKDTSVGPVIGRLIDLLGWSVTSDGHGTTTLCLGPPCPTVLVIDDNQGLVELLNDYLTGQACQVTAALSGPEGLMLAKEKTPDAILLDVMLPEMDGWELLQRLKNHPKTASVPVIVCSVIDNPDLAYSLGASLFVPKPVGRSDVLEALRQLGVV